MKNVVFYGAGKRGQYLCEKFDSIFPAANYTFIGFLDSDPDKLGKIIYNKPVLALHDVKSMDNLAIVITVTNQDMYSEVKELLQKEGLLSNVYKIENLLPKSNGLAEFYRENCADFHVDAMNTYFEAAEANESLQIFWAPDSPFFQKFCKLELDNVVELACGHGRHVPQYLKNVRGGVTLVDILEKNINLCKERFSGIENIKYYCNNGYDLSELESNSYSALFTYDAMVHFELLDIYNYLKETYRILKPGGRALFHHSNDASNYEVSFMTGNHGRNFNNKTIFAHLADRAGLSVLEQTVIDWGSAKDLDCITLVEKSIGE